MFSGLSWPDSIIYTPTICICSSGWTVCLLGWFVFYFFYSEIFTTDVVRGVTFGKTCSWCGNTATCRFAISSHVSVFSDGTVIKVSEAFFIAGASVTGAKGAKFMGTRRENKSTKSTMDSKYRGFSKCRWKCNWILENWQKKSEIISYFV